MSRFRTGDISLIGDLKQELYEVYLLNIVAYDGVPEVDDDPGLTSDVTVVVQVLQVVTVAPGTGIGFISTKHSVSVDENAQVKHQAIILGFSCSTIFAQKEVVIMLSLDRQT